jgi:hypothetical protein
VRASIVGLALPHIGNGSCGGVVTVSVGVATHRPREQFAGNGQDQLVQTADDMLYEAKRLGRNRVMTLQARPTDPVAPVPADENERIAAVEEFGRLLDGERAAYLDNVAQLAASLLGAPIGLVSLVGRDEQVFVGRYGLDDDGTPRDVSFCAHAMSGERILVVPDATIDPRFKDNALVTGSLGIRFYAGAPLKSLGGGPSLGALCVIDQTARPALTPQQQGQLLLLSTLAMGYIDSLGDRRPGPDLARA